ncbi:MAG: hypothetical protein JSV56_11035 [Methanomassiliicoccales archaeon]|nr:MAG: hypothetical protein JSV56_11035 [Methanomassiliicoccales archaeon]
MNSTRLDWYFETLEHDPRPQSEKDEQVKNQFNPFIKENIPPKIENIGIKTSAKYHTVEILLIKVKIIEHCYTKITVEISDVSEFTVTVKVLDNGKYVTFSGQGNEVFEAIIDIDFLTDYLVDYRIKIIATDFTGNEIEWEKKVNGVFGGLLDAIADIWNIIVDLFEKAWDIFKQILSFIRDWVLDEYKKRIQNALDSARFTKPVNLREYSMLESALGNPNSLDGISMSALSPLLNIMMSMEYYISALKFVAATTFTIPFIIVGLVTTNDLEEVNEELFARDLGQSEEIEEFERELARDRRDLCFILGIICIGIGIIGLIAFGAGMILIYLGIFWICLGIFFHLVSEGVIL